MPNQADIMAGTMATNVHHVASSKVAVGLITELVTLDDAVNKVANSACTDRQSMFPDFYSSLFCRAISTARIVRIY